MLDELAQEFSDFIVENAEQPGEKITSAAEQLAARLRGALPANESWRADMEAVLVGPLVARISREDPARWSRCLAFLALWFMKIDVSADVLRHDSKLSLSTDGEQLGDSHLELLTPVTRQLLQTASPADRMIFYSKIDEWDVAIGLGESLSELEIGARELGELTRRLLDFVGNDFAAGEVLDHLRLWVKANAAVAMKVVDRWLDGDAVIGDLRFGGAQILIESAMNSAPDGWRSWREHVISRLLASNREDLSGLALHVACFAWPDEDRPSPGERHGEVLQHVARLPSLLAVFGLRAMARDARDNPVEAIETAIQLRDIGRRSPPRDSEVRVEIETALAVVVRNAVWNLRESGGHLETLLFALPHLAESPLDAASALDSVFEKLMEANQEAVRECWSTFLASHAVSLSESLRSFRELFSLTYRKLGGTGALKWLIELLVDQRNSARRAAAALLGGERMRSRGGLGLEAEVFEGLTATEAEALPWAAVANGMGEVGVELVAGVVVMHPAARSAALEALREVYRHVYPGKVSEFAKRWAEGEDGELAGAAREILESVERWSKAREASAACPDIGLTLQAEPIAVDLENTFLRRQMAAERSSGRWPLWNLVTQVPMSRGGSSVHKPDAQSSAFKSISITGEYAFRTRVDPLSVALIALEAEERLRRLLEQPS